jgi:transglutaminase-like putative cysteine protease
MMSRQRPARLAGPLVRGGLVFVIALLPWSGSAMARPAGMVLHEPIPADPREDLALGVTLEGDLPAALETSSGIVSAPDPRQAPRPEESAYGPGDRHDAFVPDRETTRPDVGRYDDPFTPSTAPFKRLEAFDGVRSDYTLFVRDTRLAVVPSSPPPTADDESFYADLVVDVSSDRDVRIPSVGPGARLVHAHLSTGASDLPVRVARDGADNWSVRALPGRGTARARLVMQVAVARAALGGKIADSAWSDILLVAPLPENVARDAAVVRAAIGVSRRLRPQAAIAKMVDYFRGFTDSDDPPHALRSVYLDLALSKKGVCRHRAFAFVVTAQSLGIPARMVANEAHAWVEIHDGVLWRRVDLGGAGRMTGAAASDLPDRPRYEPPTDPFAWPANAERGERMIADARAQAASSRPADAAVAATFGPSGEADAVLVALPSLTPPPSDDRPRSAVSVALATGHGEVHRGMPLELHGDVRADGEVCPHVVVELWLRPQQTLRGFLLGSLATGDDGRFAAAIVVPAQAPLGDSDVVARTHGDTRCGMGGTE